MTHEEIEQALDQPGFALDNLPRAEKRLLVDTVFALIARAAAPVAAPAQGEPSDMGQDYAGPDCERESCDAATCSCNPAQGERRPYPANQSDYVVVPRSLLEWAQQNIDCVEDDDERERVSAALDAAMK